MGNPEDLNAQQAGPAPQGDPPEGGLPPDGGPSPSGPSLTGHPPASSDPHPSQAQGSVEPESGDSGASADEVDDKDIPQGKAAQKIVIKKLQKERDEYLNEARRVKADFENYRKRMIRQQTEHLERAAESLIEKLLPVLDNFEQAVTHKTGYEQVQASLLATLEKEGLERIHPEGKPFDPAESDAVAHEDGDDGPVVSQVLRPGYRWKGRVVRPAMVRVRG